MKLSEARYAFIDLETTGLDPTARIIEVAVVHLDPGQLPRVAYTSRVNPQIEIPEKVTRITGISDADVADAPTWAEVVADVFAAIRGRFMAAYNVPADYRWLIKECERVGYDAPAFPWVDAYVLARSEHCDKFARGGKRLADVARRRGIVVDAHGAAGDAVTTALLLPLLAREAGVWGTDVDAYLDDQTSMALHQERDFVAYTLRQGGNGDRPDCPWHDLLGYEPPAWPAPVVRPGRCLDCNGPVVYRVTKRGQVQLEELSGEQHVCSPTLPYQDKDIPF